MNVEGYFKHLQRKHRFEDLIFILLSYIRIQVGYRQNFRGFRVVNLTHDFLNNKG